MGGSCFSVPPACAVSPATIAQYKKELRAWGGVAVPSVFSLLAELLPSLITLIFVGRLGTDALAAVSLAQTWSYGLGYIVWVALDITHSTLVSQAHGSGAFVSLYGWTLIRLLVSTLFLPLLLLLWRYVDALVSSFGFTDVNFSIFRMYLDNTLAVPVLQTYAEAFAIHLVGSQILLPPFCIELIVAAIDVGVGYALIFGVGSTIPAMGVKGAAIGNVISVGCACALYAGAAFVWRPKPLASEESQGPSGDDSAVAVEADAETERLLPSLTPEERPHGCGGADKTHEHPAPSVQRGGPIAGNASSSPAANTTERRCGAPLNSRARLSSILGDAGATASGELLPLLSTGSAPSQRPDGGNVQSAIRATIHTADGSGAPVVHWREVLSFARSKTRWIAFGSLLGANLLTISLELFRVQLLSLFALDLGTSAVAAHNAMSNFFEVASSAVYGFGEATTIRVGFHLGSNLPQSARRAAIASELVAAGWGILFAVVLLPCRNVVGKIVSDDDAVIADAAIITPYLCIAYALYSIYINMSCVLDGQGRSKVNPFVSVVGSWLVTALLAGLAVRFTNLGLPALWGSILIGNAASFTLSALLVSRSDWKQLAQCAVERSAEEEVPPR